MSPRSLILSGVAIVVVMGAIALALVVHEGKESSADPPPTPASAVTPLDALERALETPGADTPTGRLAGRLSLERQVGQLFMVGFEGLTSSTASRREWGAVLVRPSNTVNTLQVRTVTYTLGTPRKGRLPALVTAAEPATGAGFPSVRTRKQPDLARAGPRVIEREATRVARRLRALGFRMALTPLADVAAEGGFREERAFGIQPKVVADSTRAAVEGYLAGRVAPAPGNFPGDGGVARDPDTVSAPVGLTLPELRVRDLVPFKAVSKLAPAIQMTNAVFVAYDGVTPATLLPEAVDGLLRRELGFRGVIASADLGATSIAYPITVPDAAVEALKAGCDLLVIRGTPDDQVRAYDAVLAAVRSGKISRLRLMAAVRRVLALKIAAGVMRPDGTPVKLPKPPKPKPPPPPPGTILPDGTTVPFPATTPPPAP